VLLIDEITSPTIEFPQTRKPLLELDRMEFFVLRDRRNRESAPPPDRIITVEQRKECPRIPAPCFFHYSLFPMPNQDGDHRGAFPCINRLELRR